MVNNFIIGVREKGPIIEIEAKKKKFIYSHLNFTGLLKSRFNHSFPIPFIATN